jgi:poly-beta-1,6-N-acetyl-D-glucosamine synthase
MVLLLATIFLFTCYSILIIYYWLSWRSIPEFILQKKPQGTRISIIIPARNEEENIGTLLAALEKQSYPKILFEAIVVNDHSTDNTAGIVGRFSNVILINLDETDLNSYKKKAIEKGIAAATGELIVTTDADCVPPSAWLEMIAAFREQNRPVFIAAPVIYENDSSLLGIFQSLDFMILQGITGASVHQKLHSMANGANLAYEKIAFDEVNGFSGIDAIASGDDMLLMHKISRRYPGRVQYLKSRKAIVTTQPMKNWRDFFSQRIRWASKAKHYDDKRITAVLVLVYFFNLIFPVLLIAGIWDYRFLILCLLLWIVKSIIEFPFVAEVAAFFSKKFLLKWHFFFQPLHIFYTIIAGFLGLFGKYEWKGRKVR